MTTEFYELRTSAGRSAAAQRDAAAAARDLDRAIERRMDELILSDPVLLALSALRRFATALPAELLRRQWTPQLTAFGEVRWKPPPP